MESWQEDLILRNRDRLIRNTVCSTLFLNIFFAKGILSAEDVEQIGVEVRYLCYYRFKNQVFIVFHFYDTLEK